MSVWDQFGTEAEFKADVKEIMPFHDDAIALLTFRNALGLTQTQMADRLGTTKATVTRLESGEHEFRVVRHKHDWLYARDEPYELSEVVPPARLVVVCRRCGEAKTVIAAEGGQP